MQQPSTITMRLQPSRQKINLIRWSIRTSFLPLMFTDRRLRNQLISRCLPRLFRKTPCTNPASGSRAQTWNWSQRILTGLTLSPVESVQYLIRDHSLIVEIRSSLARNLPSAHLLPTWIGKTALRTFKLILISLIIRLRGRSYLLMLKWVPRITLKQMLMKILTNNSHSKIPSLSAILD